LLAKDLVFAEGWSTFEDFAKKCAFGGALVAWKDGNDGSNDLEAALVVESRVVVAFQVFFPPGTWFPDSFADMAPCSPEKWKALGFANLALGKAVCVHPKMQGLGIGEMLFKASFDLARKLGADGMLSHVSNDLLCFFVFHRFSRFGRPQSALFVSRVRRETSFFLKLPFIMMLGRKLDVFCCFFFLCVFLTLD
jgi:GNAT superfamily N-acetyltransferase